MDENGSECNDDSGFEVIHSSDEDDCATNSSLWSSTLQISLHGSITNSFSSQMTDDNFNSIIQNVICENKSDQITFTQFTGSYDANLENESCAANKNHSVRIYEMDCSPPLDTIANAEFQCPTVGETEECSDKQSVDGHQLTRNTRLLVTDMDQYSRSERIDSNCALSLMTGKIFGSNALEEPENIMVQMYETDYSPPLDTTTNAKSQCTLVEKTEDCFDKQILDDHQLARNTRIPMTDLDKYSRSKGIDSNYALNQQVFGSNVNRIFDQTSSIEEPENTMVQMHPHRKNCSKRLCCVIQEGLKVYSWIRNNRHLQNIAAQAKLSLDNFIRSFDLEMNSLIGLKQCHLNILIIADETDALAIEEAFNISLGGQVDVSRCQVEDASIPVIPIGLNWALHAAQCKINKARESLDPEDKRVMVSSVCFIAEIIPRRWQMGTVLSLEDPNLPLNLHNFTSTIPVPNEYVYQAHQLTPQDYPFKGQGLAVNLEEAIQYTIKTNVNDAQEFLSGINHFASLKSAVNVLAGMYKQYVKKIV